MLEKGGRDKGGKPVILDGQEGALGLFLCIIHAGSDERHNKGHDVRYLGGVDVCRDMFEEVTGFNTKMEGVWVGDMADPGFFDDMDNEITGSSSARANTGLVPKTDLPELLITAPSIVIGVPLMSRP